MSDDPYGFKYLRPLPRGASSIEQFVCQYCGATISKYPNLGFDPLYVHDRWHVNQSRVAEDAHWGGLNRPLAGPRVYGDGMPMP